MSDTTPNFGLSDQQREAMIGEGNLFLTACPGSGKTRSVAARAAWLKANRASFALLSHTKVGAKEIATAAYDNHRVLIKPEAFVGTLHSFLLRYVLLPFGHVVTSSLGAVRMDEDAVAAGQPAGVNSLDYRFLEDGEIELKKPRGDGSAATLAAVKQYKLDTAATGYVSFDDALYWSYRVLTGHAALARAVVERFDELLIDEAQDSSAMQIACVRALHQAGLKSLVLVGDFDQSIYGFGGAAPRLSRELARVAGLREKRLTENYRSSQLICNVSARFRELATPDRAVGPDKDYEVPPLVILYPPNDVRSLPETFRTLIDSAHGDFEKSVIVTRANALANAIRGRHTHRLPALLELLLRIKVDGGALKLDDLEELQRTVLRRAFGSPPPSLPLDLRVFRSAMIAMIDELPLAEGDLHQWATGALNDFDRLVRLIFPIADLGAPLSVPRDFRGGAVEDFIAVSDDDGMRVESVHGVKGESVDAVMVVAEAPAKEWFTPQADTWALGLSGQAGERSEEIRIFYVAATRARRLLVLAVPDDTSAATIQDFQNAGFERVN